MNWSSALNALPLGLLMFVVLAWRSFRRRSGYQQAKAEYPELAVSLGLDFVPAKNPRQVGLLRGVFGGFAVVVDPDDQRKIIVRFQGEPGVDLRNYELPRRPLGLEFFSSRDRVVDTYFKTSYAMPEIAERLRASNLASLIEPFALRHRDSVKELNVTTHGVTCLLDFGNPPHIPAGVIRELLPALVKLAEVIEPLPESKTE